MNGSLRTIAYISSFLLAAGSASARPAGGRKVPTGIYLYQLDTPGTSMTKKMVLMK